jgi:hypothetical protein
MGLRREVLDIVLVDRARRRACVVEAWSMT